MECGNYFVEKFTIKKTKWKKHLNLNLWNKSSINFLFYNIVILLLFYIFWKNKLSVLSWTILKQFKFFKAFSLFLTSQSKTKELNFLLDSLINEAGDILSLSKLVEFQTFKTHIKEK